MENYPTFIVLINNVLFYCVIEFLYLQKISKIYSPIKYRMMLKNTY